MASLGDRLTATSASFSTEKLERILQEAMPFTADAHVLYPADRNGQHLRGFFALEPIVRRREFVEWIRDDIVAWIRRRGFEFDVLFAPAAPPVRPLADAIAAGTGTCAAYWEYFPTGRFGHRLVGGVFEPGNRALVFNGVSLTGRCVGLRLPEFVEHRLGGTTVAAAVFAKGVAPKVHETEALRGDDFYSAIQADVPIYAPTECPLCATAGPPVPWTELVSERIF